MASNIGSKLSPPDSKLLRYTPIEQKDPNDAYLESCFSAIQQNRCTMDSNTLLQIGQANKKNKEHISHGLLYGILIDGNTAAKLFHDLLLLNGTNLSSIIALLENLINKNWRRILDNVRIQLLWFLRETLTANIDAIDRLYYVFLRQINPSEQCLELCETIIELLLAHPLFLKSYPEMMLLTIYTLLCIVPIYSRTRQQRQIEFILTLARDNLHCIGRDIIRLLIQIGHIREIDIFLKHLSQNASADYLPKILALQTEPKYLALPLSFDLEKKLQFLLDNCRMNSQERYYFEWFQAQFLNFKHQPDSIFLCSHIIRYVCVVCRNQPGNKKVTRWAFIAWLLTQLSTYQQSLQQILMATSQTAINAAAVLSSPQLVQVNEQLVQCRLAIYYDWFLFDIMTVQQTFNEFDVQLNSIDPGYQLLARPFYTKSMLLFLLHTSEHLISTLKSFMQQNIARLFAELFQRCPIVNGQQLLQTLAYDREICQRLHATFFVVPLPNTTIGLPINDDVVIISDDISPNAVMPMMDDDDGNDVMIMSANAVTTSSTMNPRFSDDEEDDDDDDDDENRPSTTKSLAQDYDDDEIMIFCEDLKPTGEVYSTSTMRTHFPFDRFRSLVNERVMQLVLACSSSTNRNKYSLLIQIYKQIASTTTNKRPLVLGLSNDPPGPIASFAMIKHDKTSDKFQSRLLSFFDEQTIGNALLCLWLLRDSFQNRLLPSRMSSMQSNRNNNSTTESSSSAREWSPHKLKRSIKQSSVFVLFRLIKDEINHRDIYIRLLQAMYFFQPELAYTFLYFLSIDLTDSKLIIELFDRFANDIIKLSTNNRKPAIPPAKLPTSDQDHLDFLHEILSQCEQDDTETFLWLFSFIYRIYSKKVYNSMKLIRLLLHTINRSELEQFMCEILQHRLQFFHAHKLYSLVDQTLLFSAEEQQHFWQLLATHDFVQNDYEQLFTNIIEHLLDSSKSIIGEQRLAKSVNYTSCRNTIALENVFDILRTKIPTYGLVCCLFAHELTPEFSEKLCRIWHEQHRDIFWRHLERILQKWLQRETDETKQKIDYKIGTIKMAAERGLEYILEHLKILLNDRTPAVVKTTTESDEMDFLTIDESTLTVPLSKSTIKSLINCIHKNEQLYLANKTFVDRFENGIAVPPPPLATTTTTTTTSVKRRKLEHKS